MRKTMQGLREIKKMHCLRKITAPKGGINGHTSYYCEVNNITITSNNDVLGNKWYVDNGEGEGIKTKWFATPTMAAIAYFLHKRRRLPKPVRKMGDKIYG